MLVYPSSIDLSSRTLRHLSGLLAGHRRRIGSRWRRLTWGRQALLVLAHLRCGDTYARLAAGFRIGIATAYRKSTARSSSHSPAAESTSSGPSSATDVPTNPYRPHVSRLDRPH